MPVDLESRDGIIYMYQQYFPKIYNFVYYRVYNHPICEDIVSDIFLKVLEHSGEFDPQKADFSTWIHAIARHTVIDYCRRNKPSAGDVDDYIDTLNCSMDFEEAYRVYCEEKNGEIEAFISILNEMEQNVIHMRYFQGYSGKETAQRLGINPSTERTLHERALKKMLNFFKAQGISLEDMV